MLLRPSVFSLRTRGKSFLRLGFGVKLEFRWTKWGWGETPPQEASPAGCFRE